MLANKSCSLENGSDSNKRKRRPAGTPDPDAEVVSLSPKTLLESDRFVCEICNQGFQRDQNLQMHRRRHKVPWKLLKRETPVARKRVFVCPEPSCLHHDPCHALGDLVGIKKHFRRKHSNHKQWVCQKCSKGYAVQSDYKAHLKTCGTRGHSCDCGRVFSRVESFIEHQDACQMSRGRPQSQAIRPACLSGTASSSNPSSDTNFSTVPWPSLELQLLTTSNPTETASVSPNNHDQHSIQLQLSIGSSSIGTEKKATSEKPVSVVSRLKDEAVAQLRLAMAEKAYAEEARQQAKRQIELAEHEFARAKRIRQQAQAESAKAQALKNHAVKQIKSTILQITCRACKQRFQATTPPPPEENCRVVSYISSALTEGEVENDSPTNLTKTTNK
ncbi:INDETERMINATE(ID)-DOMAIN 15, SHOOT GRAVITROPISM 5, ARABIDOPSIS THALIANA INDETERMINATE(ID)-DOMAIN 15 [Hibiscus trionum]|uniref:INDETERMINATE(ID)-DOMAIN 15, SHOOT GRAVITROPISM 5, ARABIDOPSIS THALIANA INDETERMINATE(ID)-DOMAIN 15 n=1 Tax=Hibiscus trionum TaxID=183268 RepID=A0A9W7MDL8_HIBTR|nr:INDETERMINATE(ID)-DOMAIN 15, SHOOT GRAVITROPISM 5, ARABIDOPSIS THALIANA INDETERMINATE(ID)-DOMAIN 15 [Hibiscus trionum]